MFALSILQPINFISKTPPTHPLPRPSRRARTRCVLIATGHVTRHPLPRPSRLAGTRCVLIATRPRPHTLFPAPSRRAGTRDVLIATKTPPKHPFPSLSSRAAPGLQHHTRPPLHSSSRRARTRSVPEASRHPQTPFSPPFTRPARPLAVAPPSQLPTKSGPAAAREPI
jgi:hypothetical protein